MHEDGGIREIQYVRNSFQGCYVSIHMTSRAAGADQRTCSSRLKNNADIKGRAWACAHTVHKSRDIFRVRNIDRLSLRHVPEVGL